MQLNIFKCNNFLWEDQYLDGGEAAYKHTHKHAHTKIE